MPLRGARSMYSASEKQPALAMELEACRRMSLFRLACVISGGLVGSVQVGSLAIPEPTRRADAVNVDLARCDRVEQVRGKIGHPIIDADGHQLECMPMVLSIMSDLAGRSAADRLVSGGSTDWPMGTRPTPAGPAVRSFYGLLTENTLDRVTPAFPKLLHSRMDQIGIDFAVLYPTFALLVPVWPEDEVRTAAARAVNMYSAQVFEGYRDRLEPAALIPMVTPDEAVAELDFGVGQLGLKAVMMSAVVPRSVTVDRVRSTVIDTVALDSPYDYDVVWAKCRELGVAPVFHGSATGWGTRCSATNYVFNHTGSFAAAQEAAVRSIFLGGVPRRFPELRFAFLEAGVSWAAQLCVDLLSHYAKRNKHAVLQYDPKRLNMELARQLAADYAHGPLIGYVEAYLQDLHNAAEAPGLTGLDDFAMARIDDPEQIIDIFSRQFFFGCEADDTLSAIAFQKDLLPPGLRLNAMLASDLGHFDVPDFGEIVPEAWELVEKGVMSREDFRDFAGGNVARFLSAANPAFFDGTVVSQFAARSGE